MRSEKEIIFDSAERVLYQKYEGIRKALIQNEGLTLNQEFEAVNFENGFQVSVIDVVTVKTSFLKSALLKEAILQAFMILDQEAKKDLRKNLFIGLWYEGQTVCIDVSVKIDDKRKAIIEGRKNNQKAVFDWKKKESIYI